MAVLLGTLRPSGPLGDLLDSSYQQGSAVKGNLYVPAEPTALTALAEEPAAIEFLRFAARVTWWPNGIGPLQPTIGLLWKVGPAEVSSDPYLLDASVAGNPVFSDLPPTDLAIVASTQPNGVPWSFEAIAQLRMRAVFYCNDHGSGTPTTGLVAELSAGVWGMPVEPPPPPPPPDAPASDTIRAAALRSGNIHQGLRAGGIRAPLRSMTPTAALRSGNLRGPGGPA